MPATLSLKRIRVHTLGSLHSRRCPHQEGGTREGKNARSTSKKKQIIRCSLGKEGFSLNGRYPVEELDETVWGEGMCGG